MSFPKTSDEMKAQGYSFSNDAVCRGCGQEIEWWKTPNGKSIPMDPMERGTSEATSHWATCSEAPSFRKSKTLFSALALLSLTPLILAAQSTPARRFHDASQPRNVELMSSHSGKALAYLMDRHSIAVYGMHFSGTTMTITSGWPCGKFPDRLIVGMSVNALLQDGELYVDTNGYVGKHIDESGQVMRVPIHLGPNVLMRGEADGIHLDRNDKSLTADWDQRRAAASADCFYEMRGR